MSYSYPKNDAEWWTNVVTYWKDLFSILSTFLPTHEHEGIDGEILIDSLGVHLTALKEERDPELARYFNAAWAAAPDNRSIHSIPSWNVLCDLCSEVDVLYDVGESHG